MRNERCFTLVLTLLLLALLIAAGSALAAMGAVSAMGGARISSTLEHELAVDSLLECLPALLTALPPPHPSATGGDSEIRFQLTVGRCKLDCHSRPEAGKVYVPASSNVAELIPRLRDLARAHGLRDVNVLPQPIRGKPHGQGLPAFVWFDQVIRTTEFEEVFHWRVSESASAKRTTWSDLLTFWRPRQGISYGLDLQTQIDQDRRSWYVVVAIQGDTLSVLHRSAVP